MCHQAHKHLLYVSMLMVFLVCIYIRLYSVSSNRHIGLLLCMVKFYSTLFTRNQSALLQLGHLHINGTQKASLKRFEFFF